MGYKWHLKNWNELVSVDSVYFGLYVILYDDLS